MFQSVKNFVKRNRTNIAIGVGLAGAAYIYARSKVTEAKDRMSSDRIAKEKLDSLHCCSSYFQARG